MPCYHFTLQHSSLTGREAINRPVLNTELNTLLSCGRSSRLGVLSLMLTNELACYIHKRIVVETACVQTRGTYSHTVSEHNQDTVFHEYNTLLRSE